MIPDRVLPAMIAVSIGEEIEQSRAVRERVGVLHVIGAFCTAVYPSILVGIGGCTYCNDLSLIKRIGYMLIWNLTKP